MDHLIFTTLTPEQLQKTFADVLRQQLEAHFIQKGASEELLTESETAAFLQVSKVTLKAWRDEGRLPFVRFGRNRIRYKKSDLLNAPQKFTRIDR